MRILLLLTITLLTKICCGQDSTTAVYISDIIEKIESRLSTEIVETRDTTIFDEDDSLHRKAYLTVHTEYYTNPQTMQLDKIIEKSLYKKTSTELVVYFSGNQPVRFSDRQLQGNIVNADFDIYYMNDNPVYVMKRNNLKGTPDGDVFLKWCYQLRTQYFNIVQEYSQSYAKVKPRFNQGRLR